MRSMVLSFSVKTSFALLLGIATVMLCAILVSAPARPIVDRKGDSRKWTLPEWIAWRDQQAALILEPTLDAHGTKILRLRDVCTRCLEVYRTLEPCLRQDPAFFDADPDRAAALGNFVRFVKAQHWTALAADSRGKEPNALGMEVTDEEYATIAAPYVAFPELLKSQEFLTNISTPSTYHEALQMILDHNAALPPAQKWIPLFFKGQFVTTADAAKTYGRLLVVIPNEPDGVSGLVDRWILFGIAAPSEKPRQEIRSVSMFAVYRDVSAPEKTQTFFSDFMRLKDPQTGKFRIVSNFVLPDDRSKNCYNCHKGSVLPIHPEVEYEFDTNRNLVEKTADSGVIPKQVNRLIMGYGKPALVHLDTEAYGPCMGPARKTRTDAFLRSATEGLNLPAASYDRIRSAMQCSRCHDRFAPINFPQSVRSDLDLGAFSRAEGMVQTYVEKGYMPPGANLSPLERKALQQCLLQEYYDPRTEQGILMDWLEGNPGNLGK
jgi:hypothetical protein